MTSRHWPCPPQRMTSVDSLFSAIPQFGTVRLAQFIKYSLHGQSHNLSTLKSSIGTFFDSVGRPTPSGEQQQYYRSNLLVRNYEYYLVNIYFAFDAQGFGAKQNLISFGVNGVLITTTQCEQLLDFIIQLVV